MKILLDWFPIEQGIRYITKEIAVIAVISGLTCKRGERVNTALY